ncbi:MAG: hypothetical protein COC00_013955 [Rhizobiales bacterium]|nr:hypothetical protein [Hyphomicrobiales bacterium]
MRTLLLLWFAPLVLFWGWYGLSSNGIDFGMHMFSREVHDLLFHLYGQVLGVPASEVPALAAGACAFDSLLVGVIAAYRWRKKWFPTVKQTVLSLWYDMGNDTDVAESNEDFSIGPMHPAE